MSRRPLALVMLLSAACSSDPPAVTAVAPSNSTAAPPASIEPPSSARPLATMSHAPSASAAASSTAPELDPTVGCLTDRDCAWGEIGIEISSSDQCMCLFGCPYIPMNVPTAKRRTAQYAQYCRPGFGAGGRPCPIDDCAMPPQMVCRDSSCQAK